MHFEDMIRSGLVTDDSTLAAYLLFLSTDRLKHREQGLPGTTVAGLRDRGAKRPKNHGNFMDGGVAFWTLTPVTRDAIRRL